MAQVYSAGVSLPATRAAAPRARRFVERHLRRWGCDRLVDDALLLASELVNNMVEHSPHGGFLSIALRSDRVRITLIDHGDGQIEVATGAPVDEARRGLLIVSKVAVAWGVEAELGAKGHAVWCDLLL